MKVSVASPTERPPAPHHHREPLARRTVEQRDVDIRRARHRLIADPHQPVTRPHAGCPRAAAGLDAQQRDPGSAAPLAEH